MGTATGEVKAGRAYVEILLNQTPLERGLKQAQKKIKAFGENLIGIGKNMLAVSGIMAAPLAFATKGFADFDDAMRMVKAVSGATESEFKRLTATAEKLGRETSYTAKQVAEAMTAMGRMGFKPDEILSAVPAVLNLARATGTELGEAAEIAANNMRVFGIETSKMSNVADILTATANGSAQTLSDLAEGLKMAGPQAAAAKDNIVNVSGALGVLANMGIKGSLAGTALRKAYSQFAKTKVQDKLKAIGVATTDANGNLRAMPDIIADIAKHMNALPTAARLGFAEKIFDLRGSLAGLQLGGNVDQMNDFIKRLQNVKDVAGDTAHEMDAGLGGAFRIFMSAVEGCQLAVGRVIGEALTPYINRISSVLNVIAEWIAAHKEMVFMVVKVIAGIAGVGAALIAAGLALKVMALSVGTLSAAFFVMKAAVLAPVIAIQGLISVFGLLKTAMIAVKIASLATWAAITSPAFLVGAALATVIAVVWQLTGAWDICKAGAMDLAGGFADAFGSIRDIAGETWETIKTAFMSGDLAGAAKVGLAALKVAWLAGIQPLKSAWGKLKLFLADSWTVIVYSILRLGNNLWYGLLYGLKNIGNAMRSAWSVLWNGIVDTFETTVLELRKAWIRTKGLFDSEAEVNAQIAVVETEYNERKVARETAKTEAEGQRQAELDEIGSRWDMANKSATEAEAKEINDHQAAYEEALSGAASEIAEAREAWKAAMEEVRQKAVEKTEKIEAVKEKTESAVEETQRSETRIAEMSTADKAMGAWSSEALDAMLGGNAQERTAKATETMVKNTQQTNKLLRKLGKEKALTYG